MSKKIAVFMGTRPEGIKMAPVVRALESAEGFAPVVVSTGQHKEMLQQVVDLFRVRVDYDLAVMRPNQTLAGLTSRLMASIDDLLGDVSPDMALVQGDTTTVLVASLACFYRSIPVGHVEAGLRTGDLCSPFPEEANRTLAAPLMRLHFPPTEIGRENLLREGIASDRVFVTGNTVIDALHLEVERQREPGAALAVHARLSSELGDAWDKTPYVLITGHRRENFGGGFKAICAAIRSLAERFPSRRFVYPVHLNPNVQQPVRGLLGGLDNVRLIPPQPYSEFVALMRSCELVLTDSGGVQEEAPGLGKPVLVMRDTTERPEGVSAGTVRLVGPVADRIVSEASSLLTDRAAYDAMAAAVNPYGDGRAAGRIVAALRQEFCVGHPDGCVAGVS